jgi:hypothetical protein
MSTAVVMSTAASPCLSPAASPRPRPSAAAGPESDLFDLALELSDGSVIGASRYVLGKRR